MRPEEPIVLWSCCLRAGIVKLGHLRRMEGLDWKTTAAVRGVRCDISETSGEAERAGAGLAVSITAGLLQSGKRGRSLHFSQCCGWRQVQKVQAWGFFEGVKRKVLHAMLMKVNNSIERDQGASVAALP